MIVYKGVHSNLMSPIRRYGQLKYIPGTTVEASLGYVDRNSQNECGPGINFIANRRKGYWPNPSEWRDVLKSMQLRQATVWGRVIVGLEVDKDDVTYTNGTKARCSKALVTDVIAIVGSRRESVNYALNTVNAALAMQGCSFAYAISTSRKFTDSKNIIFYLKRKVVTSGNRKANRKSGHTRSEQTSDR